MITFLFTGIKGSTQIWENAPKKMESTLEKHDLLMSRVIHSFNGHVFITGGNGFFVAFEAPLIGLLYEWKLNPA